MKKLSVLSIALFFCVLSLGTAFADEVKVNMLDRHAVWTAPSVEEQWRGPADNLTSMGSGEGRTRNISTEEAAPDEMEGFTRHFDFIQETKSYDYDHDRGKAS
ncbi:MAG: hypothetical protein G3M70_17480 [Candidatus Nitronauta litoralis]|uniref:Uncharacterized protein n=1 Tax=Candidatus Nitronauta litoralis TaxID=2705533 RepID=A0A7T0G1M9_9BACT|nr:MAG: hypothetical protein G3M70_17480 [Candidatus Nitronauta litoralis]